MTRLWAGYVGIIDRRPIAPIDRRDIRLRRAVVDVQLVNNIRKLRVKWDAEVRHSELRVLPEELVRLQRKNGVGRQHAAHFQRLDAEHRLTKSASLPTIRLSAARFA